MPLGHERAVVAEVRTVLDDPEQAPVLSQELKRLREMCERDERARFACCVIAPLYRLVGDPRWVRYWLSNTFVEEHEAREHLARFSIGDLLPEVDLVPPNG